MSAVVAIDGELAGDGRIAALDRGFLYGDGVFTVLRAEEGVAIDVAAHLARLAADAAQIELRLPAPMERMAAVIDEVIAAQGAARQRVRIAISRAGSDPAATSAPGGEPFVHWTSAPGTWLTASEPAGSPPPSVTAVILDEHLLGPAAAPAVKALAHLPHLLARRAAAQRGADVGLRCFPHGTVGEGDHSNVFVVRRGTVVTPPIAGIRPGITRDRVLRLCQDLGIATEIVVLPRKAVAAADEVFVTSSVRGVVPVRTVDGVPRRSQAVGERLRQAYEAFVAAEVARRRHL